MVDAQAASSIIAFQPISDRLAVITVNGTKTHIIAIYTPTETSLDSAKDDFYNQLQHALDSLPQTEVTILVGDFNAQIGKDRTEREEIMVKFGYGKINDNGLCLLLSQSVDNWQQPFPAPLKTPAHMAQRAVLYYVLLNSRFRSSIKDVRTSKRSILDHSYKHDHAGYSSICFAEVVPVEESKYLCQD